MEASALAEQVSKLALSISGAVDEAHVQPIDQHRALDALIELRRLEQLKAIAKGTGTSTYFFGDSSILGSNALGSANGGGVPGAYFIDYVEKTRATSGDKISVPRITDSVTHLSPS